MSVALVKMSLPSVTGLPKDTVTQQLVFSDVDVDNFDIIAQTVPFWYLNTAGDDALAPLAAYISPDVSRNAMACTCDVYDITDHLDGSPAGSPLIGVAFTLGPVSAPPNTALPGEVAFCVTLEGVTRELQPVEVPDGPDADAKVDRPKQRHTGRIFVGPLHSGALSDAPDGATRPSSYIRDTARLAVRNVARKVRIDNGGTGNLAVWSRKNAFVYPVSHISSDDAFDTIRSRGAEPTLRSRIDLTYV